MRTIYQYQAFGLKISSELEMPGNAPPADSNAEFDVTIRFDNVTENLSKRAVSGASFESNDSNFLLRVPSVGRYLISTKNEILIDRASGATDADLRVFLLGSVFGALIQRRDIMPLNASAVQVEDGCIAFAGESGAGKSTLAAMLLQRGYPIVSDDICAIKIIPEVGPIVFPGFRRLRLWSDTLDRLKIDRKNAYQSRTNLEKFELNQLAKINQPGLRLRRIYLLNEVIDDKRRPRGFVPVKGVRAIEAIIRNTYHSRYLEGIDLKPLHFMNCAVITKSVPIIDWYRNKKFDDYKYEIEDLERSWTSLYK